MTIEKKLEILEAKIDLLVSATKSLSEYWIFQDNKSPIVFDSFEEASEYLECQKTHDGKRFRKNGYMHDWDIKKVDILRMPKGSHDLNHRIDSIQYGY